MRFKRLRRRKCLKCFKIMAGCYFDKETPRRRSKICRYCVRKLKAAAFDPIKYEQEMVVKMRAQCLARKYVKKTDNTKCADCGATGFLHRHHPDYSKPLDVVFLCRRCHKKEHTRLNSADHA